MRRLALTGALLMLCTNTAAGCRQQEKQEGRKYGVSILAVSQRPADVSKTILSQCNNFVVLRLTNERDKGVIKNLLPDSLKSTIEFLPLLDVGEALVVGDAILLPSITNIK